MAMLEQALYGVRIVDLADEKGIYCTKLLADLGAEVIRLEKPGGDPLRRMPPFLDDVPRPDKSLWFAYYNNNKKSITLNLETSSGQDIFRQLCRNVDIVVETFQPGFLRRFGLDYSTLSTVNPLLIMTSITGFGQTGPHRSYKASDMVLFAESGHMYLVGDTDTSPICPGGFSMYHTGGALAAAATLIAHFYCGTSRLGQHIDISLQECAASLLDVATALFSYLGEIPRRRGTAHLLAYPSGTYPCKDGYVNVLSNRPADWTSLMLWMIENEIEVGEFADSEYAERPDLRWAARDMIDDIIGRFTGMFSKEELFYEGQKRGLSITPVLNSKEIALDHHLGERGYFVESDQRSSGKIVFPGAPYRLSKTPWRQQSPTPSAGEHNEIVYREIGISKDDLITLKANGVI